MEKNCFVYILTNYEETTFYIGVTSNLEKRLYEHKNKLIEGFSSKYNLNKLVYFEQTDSMTAAIAREKQLKNWHRQWKINLIKDFNPDLKDLSENWLGNDNCIDAETMLKQVQHRARHDAKYVSLNAPVTLNLFQGLTNVAIPAN